MASVRILKKEINKEVAYFIDDCYEHIIKNDENEKEIEGLVNRAVEIYDEVLDGVNEATKKDNPAPTFKKLRSSLIEQLNDLKIKLAKKNA